MNQVITGPNPRDASPSKNNEQLAVCVEYCCAFGVLHLTIFN